MEFTNARIVKKANIYYDGKITSRTVYTKEGERKTLGIVLPGEYTFSTGVAEIIEVLSGEISIRLPGQKDYTTYKEGEKVHIPANTEFMELVKNVADYCCSYED